jgi:hypothetical protein
VPLSTLLAPDVTEVSPGHAPHKPVEVPAAAPAAPHVIQMSPVAPSATGVGYPNSDGNRT